MSDMCYRLYVFTDLFEDLQSTTSRTVKEHMVKNFCVLHPAYVDDLNYIFETLAGKHPIGFTFPDMELTNMSNRFTSFRQCIESLVSLTPKSDDNIAKGVMQLGAIGTFLAPIVNRTLRLGIGASLLDKDDNPMLAKKYEGVLPGKTVAVTEKLDGNRCLARYNILSGEWEFTSRSGKPLCVLFNMDGMDTNYVYDGEIMSIEQTSLSICRTDKLLMRPMSESVSEFNTDLKRSSLLFNKTSGLINRKNVADKALIYNIFDIVDTNEDYLTRRGILQKQHPTSSDIRILPILYIGNDKSIIDNLLFSVTCQDGEGIMLNDVAAAYEHKRTSALMKYKRVKMIDMRVVDLARGKGKYVDMIGTLVCECITDDGKNISCEVGTGLSDAQREEWAINPDEIIGKIVTVGYHELTQANSVMLSNFYSLRFPRLLAVRDDKQETSEY